MLVRNSPAQEDQSDGGNKGHAGMEEPNTGPIYGRNTQQQGDKRRNKKVLDDKVGLHPIVGENEQAVILCNTLCDKNGDDARGKDRYAVFSHKETGAKRGEGRNAPRRRGSRSAG